MYRTLGKVRTTGIERGTLSAFEDFLCALLRGSLDVNEVLKDNGVISICQVCREIFEYIDTILCIRSIN